MSCPADDHGTVDAYTNHGCRCPEARIAIRRRRKVIRLAQLRGQPLREDATGTRRRLQALNAIGWTFRDIGAGLGCTKHHPYRLVTRRTWVHVSTAEKVRKLYNELSMFPGPSKRSRTRAVRAGWAPPLAWDDDMIDDPDATPDLGVEGGCRHWTEVDPVAVQRLAAGDPPLNPTRAEYIAATRELHGRGLSELDIAERLRVHPRQARRFIDYGRRSA